MSNNNKYIIEEFDPKSASDDLWDKYFLFLENLQREVHPSDPLLSRGFWKKMAIDPHPETRVHRWIVFPDKYRERIIGRGLMSYQTNISPSYKVNSHIVSGGVEIANNYRQQGLGTECLKTLIAKARELSKSTFQTNNVILQSGHLFCVKFNGEKAIEGSENRLYLKDVDWKLMNHWRNGHKNPDGVFIETFSEVPDRDIKEFVDLVSEIANQQPLGKLESRFKATPESWKMSERRCKEKGIQNVTMITREKDGAISGMTDRYYLPEESYRINVGFTGVKEKYRGRGLGKWLKAEMLFHIREKYPSVKYELTNNATSNAPMLSINHRMGYKTFTTHTGYKFKINDLSDSLGI
jgi:mycothiol synthase